MEGASAASDIPTSAFKRSRQISVTETPSQSPRAAKRVKTSSDSTEDNIESNINLSQDFSTNAVFQRRRVNPDSLAIRLGVDLVRELDALIPTTHIDMPSFAVRKELQERYDIDRRHIYDYFHSKGLRVVKEDRFGNPIRTVDVPFIPEPVSEISQS